MSRSKGLPYLFRMGAWGLVQALDASVATKGDDTKIDVSLLYGLLVGGDGEGTVCNNAAEKHWETSFPMSVEATHLETRPSTWLRNEGRVEWIMKWTKRQNPIFFFERAKGTLDIRFQILCLVDLFLVSCFFLSVSFLFCFVLFVCLCVILSS
jgi:hypothetical protein